MEYKTSCRCCLIRSPDYDLTKPYTEHQNTEIYADILKECFEINVLTESHDSYQGICTVCVVRLHDAFNFKRQVITCQQQLLKGNFVTGTLPADVLPEVSLEQCTSGSLRDFQASPNSSFPDSAILRRLLCTPCIPEQLEYQVKEVRHDEAVNVDSVHNESEDEQGDIEWLELDSEDECLGLNGSPRPCRREIDQGAKDSYKDEIARDGECEKKEDLPEHEENGFNVCFYDVNQELLDVESLKESSIKIISLDEVTVKRSSKKEKNFKKKPLIKNNNGNKVQKNSKQLVLEKPSEVMKYKENMQNVLKYSNCTPFFSKTIGGIACAYCRELYNNIQLLNKHISEKHERVVIDTKRRDGSSLSIKLDITDLKCNICNIKLNFIADLKKHLAKEHSVQFYPINDYFLEFKLTDTETLNCALCHSTFETFKMLLQHMNRHYRNYICDVCDIGYINRHRLKTHKKTHDLGDFKCSFCDKVFSTRVRLKCHEKYSHNAGPRYITNCSHCDKTFTSYYQRNKHMATEHNVPAATYKCNICDKSFIMKSHLTGHIKKVHLMERNHICSHCGNGFFRRRTLLEHMTKHNGERVFKCTVCRKAYARRTTLREHMRIHNNDRRFKCGACSMAFVQKCSLKGHMLSNHGIIWSDFEKTKNDIIRPGN